MGIGRRVITICAVLAIAALMVVGKVYVSSLKEFRLAEDAFSTHEWTLAVRHYKRAIHWYIPLSAQVGRSVERLWEIGHIAENGDEIELALLAYRSLRSGLYAVRSVYTPYADWIDRCDERIASLIANSDRRLEVGRRSVRTDRKAEIVNTLKVDRAPHVGWSISLVLGFLGWVSCTLMFIGSVFGNQENRKGRRALVWGLLIVAFYSMWIMGMLKA